MGHVLWVHYRVPLEHCEAWDRRLCPIGCLSHLLMTPLSTPSSFQLQLSSFLLNYFFFLWTYSSTAEEHLQGVPARHSSEDPQAQDLGVQVSTPWWGWRAPAICSSAPSSSRASKSLPSINEPPFLLLSISIHTPMHNRNKALLLIALSECIGNPVQA